MSDVAGLADLTRLHYLDLGHNRIADLGPLSKLHALVELNIEGNPVSSIKPLLGLPSLRKVRVGEHPFVCADHASDIAALQKRGVDVSGCP